MNQNIYQQHTKSIANLFSPIHTALTSLSNVLSSSTISTTEQKNQQNISQIMRKYPAHIPVIVKIDTTINYSINPTTMTAKLIVPADITVTDLIAYCSRKYCSRNNMNFNVDNPFYFFTNDNHRHPPGDEVLAVTHKYDKSKDDILRVIMSANDRVK